MSVIRGFEAITFTSLINDIGTLLWLSLSQEGNLQQRLVAETKRMMLDHLQSYCPNSKVLPNNSNAADD